jgi:hypothetical protein
MSYDLPGDEFMRAHVLEPQYKPTGGPIERACLFQMRIATHDFNWSIGDSLGTLSGNRDVPNLYKLIYIPE